MVLAFAVQPLVTALLAFVTFPIIEYTGRSLYGGRPIDPVDAAVAVAAGAAIIGLLVTTFGAVPLFIWLQSRGWISRRVVFYSGAVLGNVPSALIVAALAVSRLREGQALDLEHLTYGLTGAVRAVAFGSFMGIASAAVFWSVAGLSSDD